MSREADVREANIRIKRWLKHAGETMVDGKPLVINPGTPEVQTSTLWPVGSRWRVYERLKWALDTAPDAKVIDSECCVAAASTWGEALHKYALWARDEARHGYFKDRELRGESLRTPPPDPPEWAAFRRQQLEAVDRANQNAAEWIRRSAKAQMEHIGLADPVKFELAWQQAVAMGLVKPL